MKINILLVQSDSERVFQLPNDKWKEYIPLRPVVAPIHDLLMKQNQMKRVRIYRHNLP